MAGDLVERAAAGLDAEYQGDEEAEEAAAGSGSAIVGIYRDHAHLAELDDALRAEG